MIFQNISKRKVLLLIINALVSVLLISCVLFLYHYIPTTSNTNRPSIFTVEKSSGVHITKSSSHFIASSGSPTRSVIVANVKSLQSSNRRPTLERLPTTSSEEEAIDDTIYIDSDSYSDESYDSSSSTSNIPTSREDESGINDDDNDDDETRQLQQDSDEEETTKQKSKKAPMTIIERPVEQSPANDDEHYYENYEDDETDDEDIVSSGNGKIVVNIRKAKTSSKSPDRVKQKQPPPEASANYVENVYSVSSEIVSNLKSQYNSDNSADDSKQTSKSDSDGEEDDDDEDIENIDERTPPPPRNTQRRVSSKRLSGNSKKLAERSRQLILCRSANMGELCRMLN